MRLTPLLAATVLLLGAGVARGQDISFKIRQPIRVGFGKQESTQTAPAEQAPQPTKRKPGSFTKTAPVPPRPYASLPAAIFEDEVYNLGRSVRDNLGMWTNEYFRPADANINKWQKLISVYYYEGIAIDPTGVAQSIIDNLRATNPAAKYGLTQNALSGEITLDYFTWTAGNSIIEFNVFKISKYRGNTISLHFARRWYDEGEGSHEEEFLNTFKTLRPAWLAEIKGMPIPRPVTEVKK